MLYIFLCLTCHSETLEKRYVDFSFNCSNGVFEQSGTSVLIVYNTNYILKYSCVRSSVSQKGCVVWFVANMCTVASSYGFRKRLVE